MEQATSGSLAVAGRSNINIAGLEWTLGVAAVAG